MQGLSESFFARDTLVVARDLLGMRLVRLLDGERLSGLIVECEAYVGQNDSACHASRGRTPRNTVMFGPPGRAYVYFVYGIHYMLNVVTEPEGAAAAVLLRAVQPLEGIETMGRLRCAPEAKAPTLGRRFLTGGPARLTQAMAVDRAFNNANLLEGAELWLEPGTPVADELVARGPRIGINSAAEPDRLAAWRFWVRGNPCVSR